MKAQHSHFYLTDGRSDKEYTIDLAERDGGWIVECHNGRRGSTLRGTVKTKSPLSYSEALAVYDREFAARLKGGYTQDQSGQAYTQVPTGKIHTLLAPQLLNPVNRSALPSYFDDPDWVFQRKHDGNRRGFQLSAEGRLSANKEGFAVSYPESLDAGFDALSRYFPLAIDGELVGSTYVIFDITLFVGKDVKPLEYVDRLAILEDIKDRLPDGSGIRVVETAFSAEQKRALFAQMEADRREGVVGKRLCAPYVPGRPSTLGDQIKFKFLKDATCVVLAQNPTKRSVALGLLDDAGAMVPVGNCTIPPNKAVPEVGARVDISYLYAFEGGSLFQPTYKVERDDVPLEQCVLSRLQYKRDEDDESDEVMDQEMVGDFLMENDFSM